MTDKEKAIFQMLMRRMEEYAKEAECSEKERARVEALADGYEKIELAYLDVSRIGEMMALIWNACDGRFGKPGVKNLFVPFFQDGKKSTFFDDERIANSYLFGKICEQHEVVTRENVKAWLSCMEKFPEKFYFFDRYGHYRMMENQWKDFQSGYDFSKEYISFSDAEETDGKNTLEKHGLKKDGYVCFFSRNQKYLDVIYRRKTIHPNDFIRNHPVEDYRLMAECLNSMGIKSVRMGQHVEGAVNWEGCIDYAKVFYSAFLDFYLIAKAKFLVTCASGLQHIALMFNKPTLLINNYMFMSANDIEHIMDYQRDIMILQKIYDRKQMRFLNMREIFEIECNIPDHYQRMRFFIENGYVFIRNTQEEIRLAAMEMVERTENRAEYTERDEALQKRYWQLMDEVCKKYDRPKKWYMRARVGREFLRENAWLVEEDLHCPTTDETARLFEANKAFLDFNKGFNAGLPREVFVFPYHLFKRNEKVVIYGAGNVGRSFYHQAVRDKYVSVSGWVDKNKKASKVAGGLISDIHDLKQMEFDSILISVKDELVVKEIKAGLSAMGIADEKIRWDGKRYDQPQFYEQIYFPLLDRRNKFFDV